MGLLDVMTDPFGTRYKKRGWNQQLGITSAKRSLTKTFIQPFSKLNPMYHLRNAKRNVKRKLGYNSEFAKAYRSGEWGKYMKRKIMNSERSTMIMPFRENQFTPYDMQSNPFDKEQTNPTRKGIFHKLSTYAAPGALMGLVYASRKMKLMDKLRGKLSAPEAKTAMAKIRAGGKALMSKLHSKAGLAYNFTKHHAKHYAGEAVDTAKLIAAATKHHAGKFASKQYKGLKAKFSKFTGKMSIDPHGAPVKKRHGKTASQQFADSQGHNLIMPFREGRYDEYEQPRRRGTSFTEKVIMAGLVGAAGLGALKLHSALSDPTKLAINAEKAFQHMRGMERKSKGMTHALHPVMAARTAWAQASHSMHSGLATASGFLHSQKDLDAANRAAQEVRIMMTGRKLSKLKGLQGITKDADVMKTIRRSVRKGEEFKATKAHVRAHVRAHQEAKAPSHQTPNNPPSKPLPPDVERINTRKGKLRLGALPKSVQLSPMKQLHRRMRSYKSWVHKPKPTIAVPVTAEHFAYMKQFPSKRIKAPRKGKVK